MTAFHLSDLEKGVCKKIILRQINNTIETLHTVRNELRQDQEFANDQVLILVLFLIYIEKIF